MNQSFCFVGWTVAVAIAVFGVTKDAWASKTNLNRLYVPSAQASSFLQNNWNKYQENYHPNYAFDDNPATAWVEGKEGYGEGEEISWKVSSLASAKRIHLRIRSGYQKSKKLFGANSAPKQVELILDNGQGRTVATKKFDLKRAMGFQNLEMDLPGETGFEFLKLRILSTYPGTVYKDTCISDIQTFVETKVPYNSKVEKGKFADLQGWTRERLKTAAFFAKVPATFPYASTSFSRRRGMASEEPEEKSRCANHDKKWPHYAGQLKGTEPKTEAFKKVFSDEEVSTINSLFKKAKDLKRENKWFRETYSAKAKAFAIPDFTGIDFHISRQFEILAQRIDLGEVTYFESNQALSSPKNAPKPLNRMNVLSNIHMETYSGTPNPEFLYFWTKEIIAERTVSEVQYEFLLAYSKEKKLVSALTWSSETDEGQPKKGLNGEDFDSDGLAFFQFHYNHHQKVDRITSRTATYSRFDCGVNEFTASEFWPIQDLKVVASAEAP